MNETRKWYRVLLLLFLGTIGTSKADSGNPNIDMKGFLKVATEAAAYRQNHRISEDEFLNMSRQPGTIVLDARSAAKFDLLHVEGAINVSFPDIDINSLAQALPDKSARILIYCNNNFSNRPDAFAAKSPSASLNLSTYIALYNYGYRNVYELAPLIDARSTKLSLVSSVKNPSRPQYYGAGGNKKRNAGSTRADHDASL
jgi:rhodanese-related sulfurtransferase